jgi:hypothetical protein
MLENPKVAEIIRAHLIQKRKAENAGTPAPAAGATDAAAA